MVDGFRLELPSASGIGPSLAFRATAVSITHNNDLTALGGGSNIISALSDLTDATDIQGDGQRQQVRLDLGGGLHITEIDLSQYAGSSDRWGATDGSKWDATGADPITQLQTLDNAIRRTRIDSESPATLHTHEYSSSGRFEPLQVAPLETPVSFDRDEQASTFRSQLRFVDIASVQRVLDAAEQKT